jgi:ADP-ribose pyrophosphatase YjhB (NUDIX family)
MNNKYIKICLKILNQTCDEFRYRDKEIMQGIEGEKFHGLDVFAWVKKLDPKASLSLRIAALFHDIDRVVTPNVGGGFKGNRKNQDYLKHKQLHAKRSADYVVKALKLHRFPKSIIKKTKVLILHHDDYAEQIEKINNTDLKILAAADSFALFTSIAPKLYKMEGESRLKDKIRFMVNKLTDDTRIKLWEYHYDNEIFNRLKHEVIKEYYLNNPPTEKAYNYCPTCKNKLIKKSVDRRQLLTCSKCGFIFWNNPKPVVSILIEKQNKILMIKRGKTPLKDYWVLPGGYIDYEEEPETAIIRETKEETGLSIMISNLIGVYPIDNDPTGMHLDIIYSAKMPKQKISLNQESSSYKFFNLKNLPKLIAYQHRQAILDYIKKP